MHRLSKLKISHRILMALAIPAAGLLIFAAMQISDKYVTSRDMSKVVDLATLAPVISELVHEMQKERGMSAGFIASKGKNFADTIGSQRAATDKRNTSLLAAFDAFDTTGFPAWFGEGVAEAQVRLSKLDDTRKKVSSLALTVPAMAKYYTSTIANLLDLVAKTAVLSSDADVTRTTQTYASFLQAKERAGIERGTGAVGFGAGLFKPEVHNRLIGLIAEQEAFMAQFASYASDDQKAFYKSRVSGASVDEVERMRKIAIKGGRSGSLKGITASQWFGGSTDKINLLKDVEDKLAGDLRAMAAAKGNSARTVLIIDLIIGAAILALCALTLFSTIRSVARPLAGMTGVMSRMAEGETDVEVEGSARGDEIGDMSRALEVFRDNAVERASLEAIERERNAAQQAREQNLRELIAGFESNIGDVVAGIGDASSQMSETANALTGIADDTRGRTNSAAAASTEASSNMQTVASAAEQLAASIGEISQQLGRASTVVGDATTHANKSNAEVGELAGAAQRIGEVVTLIQSIAEQTNLLALNATIEAARAGDLGKGFAVVANEVKALAEQTAKATEEISQQIEGIQGSTSNAVKAIGDMTGIMDEVNAITNSISAAVEEQSAATNEISRNIQEAANGTNNVASNVEGITGAVDETAQAAGGVESASEDLNGRAASLREQVTSFLQGVSAA